MKKRSLAVLALIETDDPRLFPENLSVATAAETAALRKTVIEHLPELTRVVFVTDEETAQLMMLAHDIAAKEAGLQVERPPQDYVPPTRD